MRARDWQDCVNSSSFVIELILGRTFTHSFSHTVYGNFHEWKAQKPLCYTTFLAGENIDLFPLSPQSSDLANYFTPSSLSLLNDPFTSNGKLFPGYISLSARAEPAWNNLDQPLFVPFSKLVPQRRPSSHHSDRCPYLPLLFYLL